jgi:hypothetical protein
MKNTNPNNSTDDCVSIFCSACNDIVDDGILYNGMCEDCYDNEYSGCYGGGCIGGEE